MPNDHPNQERPRAPLTRDDRLRELTAEWRRLARILASDPSVPGAAVMVWTICAEQLVEVLAEPDR